MDRSQRDRSEIGTWKAGDYIAASVTFNLLTLDLLSA